jgi:hypothetical protein
MFNAKNGGRVPYKRQRTSTRLYGVTSRKIVLFMINVRVRMSDDGYCMSENDNKYVDKITSFWQVRT